MQIAWDVQLRPVYVERFKVSSAHMSLIISFNCDMAYLINRGVTNGATREFHYVQFIDKYFPCNQQENHSSAG